MRPRLLALAAAVSLSLGLGACAPDEAPRITDLEGPRDTVSPPGPWRVVVVATGGAPRLRVSVDGGPFNPRPLTPQGGVWIGSLPEAPLGSVLRYAAELGAARVPAGPPRQVTVVAGGPPPGPPLPGACALRLLHPVEGAVLTDRADEAPQAGIQITVVAAVEGLVDGDPARLRVGEGGTTASVSGGQVAFPAVTLPAGLVGLSVDGQVRGGPVCSAQVSVTVRPGPP